MNLSVSDLRENYTKADLLESEASLNPIEQFAQWLEDALNSHMLEPNAMTLATVTPDGKPVARMVLLKGFDEQGFVFYTNYDSAKGQQLAITPWASLVFWWADLQRQVRIEGQVEKVPPTISDEYFQSRPLGSQLGAWVSPQSQVIESREVLEGKLAALTAEYEDKPLTRPPYWGGFCLKPTMIEFWQGRPNRLHDRLRYRLLADHSWLRERLAP